MLRSIYSALILTAVLSITFAYVFKSAIISGRAHVIDGDTVVVGTTHVRLKGVDAAELKSERGEAAKSAMINIVGNSELACDLTGELSWGRQVGTCTTSTGVDIQQAIIERGYALACPRYFARYLRYEQEMAIAAQKRAKYCLTGGRP